MGGAMYNKSTDEHTVTIYKNAEHNFKVGETFTFPMGDGKTIGGKNNFPGADVVKTGFKFKWVDMTHGLRGSGEVDSVTNDGGDSAKYTVTLKTGTKPFADAATEITKIRFFWEEEVVEEGTASEIVISPSTFPGTFPQHCRAPRGKLKNANQFSELLETPQSLVNYNICLKYCKM